MIERLRREVHYIPRIQTFTVDEICLIEIKQTIIGGQHCDG